MKKQEKSGCDDSDKESGEEEDGDTTDGSVSDDSVGDDDKNDAGDKETEERELKDPIPGPSTISRTGEYFEESEPKPKKMNHDDIKNYYYQELVDLKKNEDYERKTMDREMQDVLDRQKMGGFFVNH